ncbi:MAG: hypothetical protein FJZ47_03675, partial [Candidatus Tectomicrobia bacterium]|nr:hypothetical protein [Candidatus Tectomicrobia bacterium]
MAKAMHGTAWSDAHMAWWLLALLALYWCLWGEGVATSLAGNLLCTDQQGKNGDTVSFTLSVEQAHNMVEAFGFDLTYDGTVLQYTKSFQAGELVKNFSFFSVHEASPGRIRVAGFTVTHPIEARRSGRLLRLDFAVINAGNTTLTPGQLVDGMASWSVRAGRFTGQSPPPADVPPVARAVPPSSGAELLT